MRTFIFACVHNAGRSQMSAAFFNQLADTSKARGISAGTHPAEHVHPVVVEAIHEVGIDLSDAKPQKLTAELAQDADTLITMGRGDQCPSTFQASAATTGPCRIQRGKVLRSFDRLAKR